MIGSRVYSARVPLLLAFVKHIVRRAQPRNESVFRCGDTTVICDFLIMTFTKVGSEVPGLLNPLASMIKANIRMKSDQIEASKVCRMCKS